MKRFVVFFLLFFSPVVLPIGIARADLAGDIKPILQDKMLRRVEVGIQIVRLGSSADDAKAIYRLNANAPLIPASNLKLITTAAALDRLGGEFRFRTVLFQHDNDLIIWSDGDPSFGDAEMLKNVGWDVTTVYQRWAEMLRKRNIAAVRNVIVDDSIFDEEFVHPNWPGDQLHKRYVAGVGGVNLNANCVDFLIQANRPGELVGYEMNPDTDYINVSNACITGNENAIWLSRRPLSNDVILKGQTKTSLDIPVSVTIHGPPMFAATVLSEQLRRAGIAVSGAVVRNRTMWEQLEDSKSPEKEGWTILAIHETPLAGVLARANKDSMNLYAESLLKRLGHEVSGQNGSWENGRRAIGEFLKEVGVDEAEFKLDDGSGLSKENAISPNAIARVLTHGFHGRNSKIFMESLSVAGVDGTLEDRFRDSDLRGRVFGKSGFVSGVSALSGYIKAKDNQWYVFSILMNGIPPGTNSGAKLLQERIVQAIDDNVGG